MIYIKATAKGEPDTPPLTRIFQYIDETDELILYHSIVMLMEKLEKNMKLNVNDALLMYAYYGVSEMRTKKEASFIEKNALTMLSADQVLVGVPETLQTIEFDIIVDSRHEWLVLREPISISRYIMAEE